MIFWVDSAILAMVILSPDLRKIPLLFAIMPFMATRFLEISLMACERED